jgi:hypothetical protein
MLNDSDPTRVKGVLQAMIDGSAWMHAIRSNRSFPVPAVRIESGYMGGTWLCANHALMETPAVGVG